ncbi:carboxypeptidase regulatory-like domain-containing protein [Cryobacterium melibiosiphilum]|uniref:Carboxypeptidase regulatory-like domain-containing protein n=1 Tax=Cryobacterium melibiosiphilum TaxID=995039 RepID=A0A3A5MV68_9MICO|nr:carboxypeptidase-like regulatory domain-containing protein [Cryobacterium melibiosiphilum]RJT89094.1 carboxypeptidase regulatory-like domain-containing protein [Cryobacterium melibiosiphilum]
MANFFTRIREGSIALALTVAAVLTFGALTAAPATAVGEDAAATTTATTTENLTISGTVTGETPDGIVAVAGAYVSVSDSQGSVPSASAVTDNDGRYVITGLTSDIDSLRVFAPYSQGGFGLLNSLYNSVNFNAADITVNAVLKQGSMVSGVVSKNIQGVTTPAEGIPVTVLDAVGTYWSIDRAYTASDGSYSVGSLPAGNYKVSFGGNGSATGFAPVYYGNAATRDSAETIVVPDAGEVPNIDATVMLDGTAYPLSGKPTIAGEARVGETLSVTGSWLPSDAELSYSWYRSNGSYALVGESSTYTLTEADLGSALSVRITGTAAGSAPFHSDETELVQAAETNSTPDPSATASPTPTSAPTRDETRTSTATSVVGAQSDRVTMPAATLAPGTSIPITGDGFAPFEVVEIWLHSSPVLLGTLVADAQGRISGSFIMPAGIPTGTHHIVFLDENGISYTSAALTVPLSETGANLSSGSLALTLLVLGGLALTIAARRRTTGALRNSAL